MGSITEELREPILFGGCPVLAVSMEEAGVSMEEAEAGDSWSEVNQP